MITEDATLIYFQTSHVFSRYKETHNCCEVLSRTFRTPKHRFVKIFLDNLGESFVLDTVSFFLLFRIDKSPTENRKSVFK
jgi:hypothetical protein